MLLEEEEVRPKNTIVPPLQRPFLILVVSSIYTQALGAGVWVLTPVGLMFTIPLLPPPLLTHLLRGGGDSKNHPDWR